MLKKEIAEAINKITRGFLGIKVSGTDIGAIKVPEEAESRLLAKWMAECDQHIKKTNAETEVYVREAEARARMATIASYVEGLRQVSGTAPTPENILALRLIELLEKKGEGDAKVEGAAVDMLVKMEGLQAMLPKIMGRV
jgi:regulator of protease activity HflC (stomatin/prohibitin superfamily)